MDSLKTKGVLGTAKAAAGKIAGVAGGAGGIFAGLGQGAADNRNRVAAVRTGAVENAGGAASAAPSSPQSGNGGNNSGSGGSGPVMPDSDSPAEAQQGNGAIPENQAPEPVASSTDTKQEETADPQNTGNRETIGGALKSRFVKGVQSTGAVRAAKRMYNLSYGSSMAHGDKKVLHEQNKYTKRQDTSGMGPEK